MKSILFSLIVTLAASVAIAADGSDKSKKKVERTEEARQIAFRQIPLGKAGAREALQELCLQDDWNSKSSCDFKKDNFEFSVTYGTVRVRAAVQLGSDESLEYIVFSAPTEGLSSLVDVLKKQYGPPRMESKNFQNLFGGTFPQNTFTWTDRNENRITVNSIYGRVDRGLVEIESGVYRKQNEKAKKLIEEVGKSNL